MKAQKKAKRVPRLPIPSEDGYYDVTPELAESWLRYRSRPRQEANPVAQRRWKPGRVEHFKRLINSGEFKTTHQGGAFDTEEMILDFHHRLSAIVETGVTVRVHISVNQDPAIFTAIDQGGERTPEQFIYSPHARSITTAAKIVCAIQEGTITQASYPRLYRVDFDMEKVLEIVREWPELIDYAGEIALCARRSRVNRPHLMAVMAIAARTQYADEIEAFLSGLASGIGLEAGDPRLLLRERFAREYAMLNSTSGRAKAYALIVHAWNNFVTETNTSRLQGVRTGSPLPQIAGC